MMCTKTYLYYHLIIDINKGINILYDPMYLTLFQYITHVHFYEIM